MTDFDDLPSPIVPLLRLRNDGADSVVPVGGATPLQRQSYRPGPLDEALTQLADSAEPPHVIFLTGSAGSGKSAAAEAQRLLDVSRFSLIIEDATHSDSPSQSQAADLAALLGPLADGAKRPERPILVAANTGMLLQLFEQWRPLAQFSQLEAATLGPLDLLSAETEDRDRGDLRVVVLNLDDRPTAGDGGLLGQLLIQLDPDDPDGVMGGSERCGVCPARAWCPVRTNASLASGPAGGALELLAVAAAQDRGRHDSPRAIWDWLSRIVAPPEAFAQAEDPCLVVLEKAEVGDYDWVLQHLLPVTLFSAGGDLGSRVRPLNPALWPSKGAYEIVASAGIDPLEDASRLQRLADLDTRAEALNSAAAHTREAEVGTQEARQLLGRAQVAAGFLAEPLMWPLQQDDDARAFATALRAYARYQPTLQPHNTEDEQALNGIIQTLGLGLAMLFGVPADGKTFLPLRSYDIRSRSRLHIGLEIDATTVTPMQDAQTERNPRSSALLRHQPLGMRLALPGTTLLLDLPAYRLLRAASLHGLAAASHSDERLHALRRAAEALARSAADAPGSPLLAEDDGRSYLITKAPTLGSQMHLRTRPVVS